MDRTPDGLPLLGAGRHRRPRQGACLMELVSVLAGERWTDAPHCTHPLLARLARLVNDAVSDAARPPLSLLAPTLAGLRGTRAWDAEIALLAATSALRVAAPWDQRPLAAAVLRCDAVLGGPGALRPESRAALATAPDASRWAAAYTRGLTRRPVVDASAVVEFAVLAVAGCGRDDVDALLTDLLTSAVRLAERLQATTAEPAAAPGPAQAPARRRRTRLAA